MVGNDFGQTTNPSVQNGGILLYGRCFSTLKPMFGIGMIPEIINGPAQDLAYEENRWVSQATIDGATLASWSSQLAPGGADTFNDIDYL